MIFKQLCSEAPPASREPVVVLQFTVHTVGPVWPVRRKLGVGTTTSRCVASPPPSQLEIEARAHTRLRAERAPLVADERVEAQVEPSEARRRRFVHHLALVRACSTTWVVSVYRHVVAERGARSS